MLEMILRNFCYLLFALYFWKKTKYGLHMLQLESYKNERYRKWMKQNKTIKIPEVLLLLCGIVLLLMQKEVVADVVFLFSYVVLFFTMTKQKEKKPFVVTNRIKRMIATYGILFLLLFLLGNLFPIGEWSLIVCAMVTILSYDMVILVNTINHPVENQIQKGFYQKAKTKLEQMPNLKVIGITGSYGKTSTKYIVSTILSQKYNVLMTPESYNTTMGVVRTINEKLSSTHNLFVCEMGAKNIGDIKEICDLVKPDYGILTAIGPQHLETFKTIENVKKTKLELIDSLGQNGIAFVNYEDKNIQTANINQTKCTYGMHKGLDYYADEITCNERGSEFKVHCKTGKIIPVRTKLLGRHNIGNIVGAIAVADTLELSEEEMIAGVRFLKPVPHRLELLGKADGSLVIDDAYNSNSEGAKMALEVLASFEGRKKILVTPGIVDLGEEAESYNEKLGEQAAKAADYIILVGEKQAQPILKGIQKQKFPKEKIYVAKDLKEAIVEMQKQTNSNTVTLLENDLPDNYL